MSKLIVVYGGQWGSEGKGQICAAIAGRIPSDTVLYAVRVGGPNAGHTVTAADGRVVKVQQIPSPLFVRSNSVGIIGCSGLILPDVLARELDLLNQVWGAHFSPIIIDTNAVVITKEHMQQEEELKKTISSTGEGVGAATADKVMRNPNILAVNHPYLKRLADEHWITFADTSQLLSTTKGLTVLVEGTQGQLLSLNTSGCYPFTTSRECGPEAILSQIGISPRGFDTAEIICVMRTYPIRVGGPSGPLPLEVSWDYMKKVTGGYVDTPERTTVTKKIRRIARMDKGLIKQVLAQTCPTSVALTFLDYKFPNAAAGPFAPGWPSDDIEGYIEKFEEYGTPISWISVGPGQANTFKWQKHLGRLPRADRQMGC